MELARIAAESYIKGKTVRQVRKHSSFFLYLFIVALIRKSLLLFKIEKRMKNREQFYKTKGVRAGVNPLGTLFQTGSLRKWVNHCVT